MPLRGGTTLEGTAGSDDITPYPVRECPICMDWDFSPASRGLRLFIPCQHYACQVCTVQQQERTREGYGFQCHMCAWMVVCDPKPYRDAIELMEMEQQRRREIINNPRTVPDQETRHTPHRLGSRESIRVYPVNSETENGSSETMVDESLQIAADEMYAIYLQAQEDRANGEHPGEAAPGHFQFHADQEESESISSVESIAFLPQTNLTRPSTVASLWQLPGVIDGEDSEDISHQAPTRLSRHLQNGPVRSQSASPTASMWGFPNETTNPNSPSVGRSTAQQNNLTRPPTRASLLLFPDGVNGDVLIANREAFESGVEEDTLVRGHEPEPMDYIGQQVQPSAPTPEPALPPRSDTRLSGGSIWVLPDPEAPSLNINATQLMLRFEDEDRLELSCHPACSRCLDLNAPPPHRNIDFCGSSHRLVLGIVAGLKFPIWLVRWIKSGTKSITGILHDDEVLNRPSIKNSHKLRKDAYRSYTQTAYVDNSLRGLQHFATIFLSAVILPTLLVLSIIGYLQNLDSTSHMVGLTTSVVCFVLWLVYLIIYIYQINQGHQSRLLSKFIKVMIMQDSLYEMTLCLLIATDVIDLFNLNRMSIIYGAVCLVALLVLWICRIIRVLKFKDNLRVIFDPLIFTVIGNCLITLTLLLLTCKGYTLESAGSVPNLFFLIVVGVAAVGNHACNVGTFYVSYLYDISVESALVLADVPSGALKAKELLDDLHDLPVFHKNMFPLALARFACFVFLWPLPIVALLCLSSRDTTELILLSIYCVFHLIFNHRIFAMTFMLYMTLFLIVGFVLTVIIIIVLFTLIYYGTCGVPIVLIMFVLMVMNSLND